MTYRYIEKFIAQFMCFVLKEIVACICKMLFDFCQDIQFCQATLCRPTDYDNVII